MKIACCVCGKSFKTWPYRVRDVEQVCCSVSCAMKLSWRKSPGSFSHLELARQKAHKARLGSKHTEETKKQISDNRKGKASREKNPKWKGGIGTYRKMVKISSCNRCGSDNYLVVHHIDRNRYNNKLDNLEVLCAKCHCAEHGHFNRHSLQNL